MAATLAVTSSVRLYARFRQLIHEGARFGVVIPARMALREWPCRG